MTRYLISLALACTAVVPLAASAAKSFSLSMAQAETAALTSSNLLKSYSADQEATRSQADAQFESLLPRLSIQGSYQYFNYIPTIGLGFGPFVGAIPFGTHSVYSAGPQLNYTLWDSFSARKSYHSAEALEQSKEADRDNARLQVLASTREAYVQVQLGLEELALIHDSMELSRAQERDVLSRFHAGAAAKLDVVTAQRQVLAYEIQFKARQAELSASLKDLLTLLGDHEARDLTRPGPPDVPGVTFPLELETLATLLKEEDQGEVPPPGDDQPQIKSQLLQSQSFELGAESQTAKYYPTLQLQAGVNYTRPDIPNPPSYWQESVGATLSLPLYIGDPTRHAAAQARSEADAARFRAANTKDNVDRDFAKAREMLLSLREQRKLAQDDISESEEEARLYYTSYKAGRINLIDVQNANNQALQSKVSAARIDAQLLTQLITLQSLSGKELRHD